MDRLTGKKSRNPICAAQGGLCVSTEFVARLAAYEDAMPLERAQELVKVEKDGRLAILPPNDPLTEAEMQEMGGEPVWVERNDGANSRWAIVGDFESLYGVYFGTKVGGMRLPYEEYGKTWTAYRRKPEEDRNAET